MLVKENLPMESEFPMSSTYLSSTTGLVRSAVGKGRIQS
jgi:hypothetical protein